MPSATFGTPLHPSFTPFYQSIDDEGDWLLSHNGTKTSGTGPNKDGSTTDGTGNFAYIEASNGNIGDRVSLLNQDLVSERSLV